MKFGLQARLMSGLVAATTLLVVLIGWQWIALERRDLDEALRQREARMVSLIERGFAGPIWNLDHVAVDNLLEAVMADPEVHAVELRGLGLRGGLAQRQRGNPALDPLKREFAINYQPAADAPGTKVADAVLVYTRELVQEQVGRSQVFVVQLLVAVVAAVVGAGYLLVLWLVRRPVERLGRLAQRVAAGELGAQMPVARADELGELTARFNEMSLALYSSSAQRQAAEGELTRHRDHLEDLVTERTAELSEAMLRAESANQAKGRFLATMSHEFRTPLNAILGFTQLLQMDASQGPSQQNKLQLMRESGNHLLALISDVLDMASIEAGKVTLKPVAVDLRALLDIASDSVRLRAEQKGLGFALLVDAGVPTQVMADGQRLRQVLLNLLANAVKFTDSGEVRLCVKLLEQHASHARLRFEVQDTGIGMDAAQQARLFQAFEQVSEASRTLGGTGLGLSISQQLVRLMGSQITAESAAGQGSSFVFELSLPITAA
jgi:signal transduction histidine kinase